MRVVTHTQLQYRLYIHTIKFKIYNGFSFRYICIFGVGDLPWLYKRPELFANKFFEENQYYAYDCMEELIRNRTIYHEQSYLDMAYYKKLPFVQDKDRLVIR